VIVYKLKVHETQGKEPKLYIYVADVMKSLTFYEFNGGFPINRLMVKAWHSSGQWCLEMLRLGSQPSANVP
jgi:hypothetical protein